MTNNIKQKEEEIQDDITLDLYDEEVEEDTYIDQAELDSDNAELKAYYANLL